MRKKIDCTGSMTHNKVQKSTLVGDQAGSLHPLAKLVTTTVKITELSLICTHPDMT